MRFTALALGALLALVTVNAVDAQYTLSVSGTGVSGTKLVFTTSGSVPNQNKVAFLGLSPLQGTTTFPLATMDLGWPIFASGMGSLRTGSKSHNITVPQLPVNFVMTWYAQSLVVTPAGAGYITEKTNVIPFQISGS